MKEKEINSKAKSQKVNIFALLKSLQKEAAFMQFIKVYVKGQVN